MRLIRYINEAAIRVNPKEIKLIHDTINRKRELFLKHPDNRTMAKIKSYMDKAAKEISGKIKDVDIVFEITANPNRKGSATMGYPKHTVTIFYEMDWAYTTWRSEDQDEFDGWLENFTDICQHELVHVEQYRRIGKEKSPEEAMKTLNLMRDKAEQKNRTEIDNYLNYSLEIMAHAKSADAELSENDPVELLKQLRDYWGQDELALTSGAFDAYFLNIRDKYPKTWKKFMKYLVMYIEKRIKK